jgi:hypothetical protein
MFLKFQVLKTEEGVEVVRFPTGTRYLSLLQSVQNGSRAHPASSGYWGAGRVADHVPPHNVEFKKCGAIPHSTIRHDVMLNRLKHYGIYKDKRSH